MSTGGRLVGVVWALCAVLAWGSGSPAPALAQAGMPDPSLMAGRALPAPELPTGTVTVRVMREAVGNDVPGVSVQVTVAGAAPATAETDGAGRAEFPGLPPGAEGRAEVEVDGERLVSEPFLVPASGGLRVILISGIAEAAAERAAEEARLASEPAVPGAVVLGGNSRIIMEFQEDALRVFYLLEIVNGASSRVDIGGPFLLDLPTGASGAATLQGSSPLATIRGDRLTVTGPFPPGATSVQLGFEMPYDSATVVMEQPFPVPFQNVTVAVEQVGALTLQSAQLTESSQVRADDGTAYLMASGPALPAGGALVLELGNLPVHSQTPRNVALVLAAAALAFGVWLSVTRRPVVEVRDRAALVRRRDTLLSQLAPLEARHRSGTETEAQGARRRRLLTELEHIYGELDEAAPSGPQGGGEGVAA